MSGSSQGVIKRLSGRFKLKQCRQPVTQGKSYLYTQNKKSTVRKQGQFRLSGTSQDLATADLFAEDIWL
jgi:hypothetical protein